MDGAFVGNTEASFTYRIPPLAFSFAVVQGVWTRKGISGNCGTRFIVLQKKKIKMDDLICFCNRTPTCYDRDVFIPSSPTYHVYDRKIPLVRGPLLVPIVALHNAFPWVFQIKFQGPYQDPCRNCVIGGDSPRFVWPFKGRRTASSDAVSLRDRDPKLLTTSG